MSWFSFRTAWSARGPALWAFAMLAACNPDVKVTVLSAERTSFEPSLPYAYYREDPVNRRIHVRFADYWNPCVADAQFQNQILRNSTPAQQADAYQQVLPRRTWTADLYLTLDRWPDDPQENLSFTVVPQQSADEPPVTNYELVCLLRQCPYEGQCDRCLPEQPGAVAGFSRTNDFLDADYFTNNFSPDRVQQYASSGTVDVARWRPAAPQASFDDTGADRTLLSGSIRGTARLSLREVGQQEDAGELELEFEATVCEAMQASFTGDLADFERRDVNPYGPSACQLSSVSALWLAALPWVFLRRRRVSNGSSPRGASDGVVAQP